MKIEKIKKIIFIILFFNNNLFCMLDTEELDLINAELLFRMPEKELNDMRTKIINDYSFIFKTLDISDEKQKSLSNMDLFKEIINKKNNLLADQYKEGLLHLEHNIYRNFMEEVLYCDDNYGSKLIFTNIKELANNKKKIFNNSNDIALKEIINKIINPLTTTFKLFDDKINVLQNPFMDNMYNESNEKQINLMNELKENRDKIISEFTQSIKQGNNEEIIKNFNDIIKIFIKKLDDDPKYLLETANQKKEKQYSLAKKATAGVAGIAITAFMTNTVHDLYSYYQKPSDEKTGLWNHIKQNTKEKWKKFKSYF